MQDRDLRYMRRAIEVAGRAPYTSPNPRVGAILVRDDEIIGEGWHEGAGTPHAETQAIAAAGDAVSGATMYVTLEPCTHHGHTGPCAPAVAAAGVRRVVVALEDPDDRVAGKGSAYLSDRGIEVMVGVGADDVAASIAPYLHHRRTGRAYLTLKLAMSLDGRIAAADGSSRWLTGPEARRYVHRRRAEADAVLIGPGTAVTDDPSLTVRDVGAERQPVRIVIDPDGRIPADLRLFAAPHETLAPTRRPDGSFGRARHPATVVATSVDAPHDRVVEWKGCGAEVLVLPAVGRRVDIGGLLKELGGRGFTEVLCEGGAGLATDLLRRGLVDRLELHTGGVVLGSGPGIGDIGVTTIEEAPRWKRINTVALGPDVVSIYEPESD